MRTVHLNIKSRIDSLINLASTCTKFSNNSHGFFSLKRTRKEDLNYGMTILTSTPSDPKSIYYMSSEKWSGSVHKLVFEANMITDNLNWPYMIWLSGKFVCWNHESHTDHSTCRLTNHSWISSIFQNHVHKFSHFSDHTRPLPDPERALTTTKSSYSTLLL